MGFVSNNIRLTQKVIAKAPGLLPMEYKLNEIAAKLDMNPHTLSDWTDAGAPHMHDSRGHIWIIGTEFSQWVEETRKQKNTNKEKLSDGQAYCMRCRKAVDLINPTIIPAQGKLILIKGTCPQCGCAINRGGRIND